MFARLVAIKDGALPARAKGVVEKITLFAKFVYAVETVDEIPLPIVKLICVSFVEELACIRALIAYLLVDVGVDPLVDTLPVKNV